jgi:hypothetical protein
VSRGVVYSVDTSALIDGLERHYGPTSFPSLWERIDDLIDQGRLVCSEEVLLEATLRDLPAKEWCLEREDRLVVATDASVAIEAQALLGKYPEMTKSIKGRNRADPFVIVVAKMRRATVVTGEGQGGSASRPKIPWVCAQLGIPCIRLADLIAQEGWSF